MASGLHKIAMKISVRLLIHVFKIKRPLTKNNVPVIDAAVMYYQLRQVM